MACTVQLQIPEVPSCFMLQLQMHTCRIYIEKQKEYGHGIHHSKIYAHLLFCFMEAEAQLRHKIDSGWVID